MKPFSDEHRRILDVSERWYPGKFLERLTKKEEMKELPPFPDVQRERTQYGYCLRTAFAVGEWQDKVYRHAIAEEWFPARENAKGIIHKEQQLTQHCNVDTRRAQYVMNKILEAIEKKDKQQVVDLLSEHDTEILAALETAKKRV